MRRRNYRNLAVFGLGIFVAVFLFVFLAQKFGKIDDDTSAANLKNFQAGYIISDYQMTDYNSMSEADIQNFLWSKGRCYNTNFSGVGARVDYFSDHTPPTTWHVSNGHTVCLAEENMNGESAAHIIWQAAQDYHINPKVLIVLVQKETGLITDPIPNSWDYQRTAGYGCPDTAACSEKYYGFKNQIRNAAYLFRIVMDGNSSYYPIGNNYIQYNPNAGCGGSVVYIQNLATSALYRYTPYQPNAGALAAGYGTASCGAYGNRNFYAYFEDWFGDITKYHAELDIKGRYDRINGKETLGEKTAGINCNIGHDGACVQAYEKGVIIYNATTGAWENYGDIRSRYIKLGSVDNIRLGFPTSSINCYTKGSEKYCVQAYERGIIVDSDNHGTWENFGMIRQRYKDLGSVNSSLGFPTGEENCNIGHNGACVQAYENGVIIAQASIGAWESYGKIKDRYVILGSVDNIRLGLPTSSINCYTKGSEKYCVQAYERGIIVDSDNHGTWENFGMIRQRYKDLGSVNSSLGFPTGEENCNIGHNGACVQAYENGVIIAQASIGAWESYGKIRARHVELGSVDGVLGFPTAGMNCNIGHNGACVQAYENGVIIYSPETGAWESYGEVRSKHIMAGSVDGSLGFPISGVKIVNGVQTQKFQGGAL